MFSSTIFWQLIMYSQKCRLYFIFRKIRLPVRHLLTIDYCRENSINGINSPTSAASSKRFFSTTGICNQSIPILLALFLNLPAQFHVLLNIRRCRSDTITLSMCCVFFNALFIVHFLKYSSLFRCLNLQV